MGNVSGFKKYIVENLAKLDIGNISPGLIKTKLDSMSDKEIDALYVALKAETTYLPFYVPNVQEHKIDIRRWIKVAKELGVDTFVELVQEDEKTGLTTISDIKYWVAMWPAKRHLQYLTDKRSLAKDNKTRDTLTGQVTGASKGSSFSKPQLMGVLSRGCTANALELYKYRGGDIAGGREMNKQLTTTGGVSLQSLLQTNTKPTVNKTVGTYLNGLHFGHNLTSNAVS